jgi:hypothetical protein
MKVILVTDVGQSIRLPWIYLEMRHDPSQLSAGGSNSTRSRRSTKVSDGPSSDTERSASLNASRASFQRRAR